MVELTLFGARLSPYVEKVASALEYKGLAFETVDLKSPGDLKKWNPTTGKMPVLEIDGEKLYDSTFILRRLDELQPEPRLYAEHSEVAARQRLMEDWCDESLYWYVMALRWAEPNKAATIAQIVPSSVPRWLLPLVGRFVERQIGGMVKAQGMGRMPYELVLRETGGLLDALAELLGARPYFHTERPGAADFALYGELVFGASEATPDFGALLADRPALTDFVKRLADAKN